MKIRCGIKSNWKLITLYAIMTVFIIVAVYVNYVDRGYAEVFFMDVGQGDACVVRTSKGKTVLIDGGDDGSGEYILMPFLRMNGVWSVEAAFISHLHNDHTEGIYELIDEGLRINKIYVSEIVTQDKDYKRLKEKADSRRIEIETVSDNDIISFDEITFKVISDGNTESAKSVNDKSLVMRMDCGENSFLFTGDITKRVEDDLVGNPDLDTDFLKVAHHGSGGSSSEDFIKEVSPVVSVISVGEDNSYEHPSKSTVNTIRKNNSEILRTDEGGTITFVMTENNILKIETTYGEWGEEFAY